MKKKRSLSSVSLFILFAMMITIIVLIVVLNLVFQDPDNWRTLLFDLMGDLLSAIVIGLFVGSEQAFQRVTTLKRCSGQLS